MKYSLLTCILITLYFQLISAPALAQSASLSLSPPTVEIILAPNKILTQSFTVHNSGESGQFVVSLHSVKPTGIYGQVELDPRPLRPASLPLIVSLITPDLTFSEPFTLASNESRQLTLNIEGASVDAPIDTYLGLVVRSYLEDDSFTGALSQAGITSLVLVTLTPDGILPVNVEVEGFDVPTLHDSSRPLTISPVLHNNSSTMLRLTGEYTIIPPQGESKVVVPLYNNLLLKESNRIIQGVNDAGDPISLSWQPRLTDIGPHTLRLTIKTVGGRTVQEVERSIWILPVRTMLILLIAIIVSSLLIILKKQSRSHPIDKA